MPSIETTFSSALQQRAKGKKDYSELLSLALVGACQGGFRCGT